MARRTEGEGAAVLGGAGGAGGGGGEGGDGDRLASLRLRKKGGDLAAIYYLWLSWEHSTPHLGSSPCYGGGTWGEYREAMRGVLSAYAQGLLFDAGAVPCGEGSEGSAVGVIELMRMRVLCAALYSLLQWNSATHSLGKHPHVKTRSYATYAKRLTAQITSAWADLEAERGAEHAQPSGGDDMARRTEGEGAAVLGGAGGAGGGGGEGGAGGEGACVLLAVFEGMRADESIASEELVRAVCSCRSLRALPPLPPSALPPLPLSHPPFRRPPFRRPPFRRPPFRRLYRIGIVPITGGRRHAQTPQRWKRLCCPPA